MNRTIRALVFAVSSMVLPGCIADSAWWRDSPVVGLAYMDTKYPAVWYYAEGYGKGNTLGPGSKTGTSTATSILYLVGTGDASVETASRNGGIKTVHTVDVHVTSVLLGLYLKYDLIVTGE